MNDWHISFDGFDPANEGLREALCTLGNGYFATRGADAAGPADAVHYPGTYLAGGYNRLATEIAGHVVENEDLVNFPDWLPLRVRTSGGPWLSVREQRVRRYRVTLALRTGILERDMEFEDAHGRVTALRERRLVSMDDPHVAALELSVTPVGWTGEVEIESGIRHGVVNAGVARYRSLADRHLETLTASTLEGGGVLSHVRTVQSRLEVAIAAWTSVMSAGEVVSGAEAPIEEPDFVGERFRATVQAGEPLTVVKRVALHGSRDRASTGCQESAALNPVREEDFEGIAARHADAWARLWRHADITLEDGPETHQRVLRLHVFHLLQTVSPHSVELDFGVPARGWHGEAYRGHVFWDEVFILPFFNLRFPDMARAILCYRHRRLPAARRAARESGLAGALFPWQSAGDGSEQTQQLHLNPESGRWLPDNSSLQRHVNLAIAYNVWQYYQTTADLRFLRYEGGELLVEIARMLASLASFDRQRGRYRITGVVGPDEYHDAYPDSDRPGIDDNAYTNVMTAWMMRVALDTIEVLPADARASLRERLGIGDDELALWDDISRRMHVPFLDSGLIAQFEGYDGLEEFDWAGYRERYGDIQRLDRILEAEGDTTNRYKLSKQADVLMLFYLLSSQELDATLRRLGYEFDLGRIPETVHYYLERTSHGSTLSEVVHAWVLSRSDRTAAWSLFESALHSDVGDSQGGTTREGIHLGAMAATVDIVQRAHTGCSFVGGNLRLEPCLPDALRILRMEIRYHSNRLTLELDRDWLTIEAGHWSPRAVHYYVRDQGYRIAPGERRRHRIRSR